jgi:amino acid adenylation domain-containing protein
MTVISLNNLKKPSKMPLSTDQHRIWFLHELNKNLNNFNINFAFSIEGPLVVDAFSLALGDLVQRHEALRTSFVAEDGVPYLQVTDNHTVNLTKVDASHKSAEEVDEWVRSEFNEAGKKPFLLSDGPMYRVALYQVSEDSFRVLFTIHHIIADFDSLKLILRELFQLYRLRIGSQLDPLPELTCQFSDYAFWQNERIRTGELDKQLEFWQDQNLGDVPPLRMPMDRPRGKTVTNNGATKRITFSRSLTERLHSLSQGNNVTLFVTLLSAYQVLLQKYTGQPEVNIGTPMTTRSQPELQGLVGLFINTLVLKLGLQGVATFTELLHQNRKQTYAAFSRQEIPFEKLVAELKPDRNINHNLFFQTMVMFLEPESNSTQIGPETYFQPFEIDKQTTTFELTLSFSYLDEALTLLVDYNTDLYDESTIAYLLQRFEVVLNAVSARPDEPISTISLLTDEEEQQLLAEYGRQDEVNGVRGTFMDEWETSVQKFSSLPAVTWQDHTLTYSELDNRATQFAAWLQSEGVKVGECVPLIARKSPEMIVAILALMKCGAAYVPIDALNPKTRILKIIDRCGASVVLTTADAEVLSQEDCQAMVVDVQRVSTQAERLLSSYSKPKLSPIDMAYMIFTSGSTGEPKGVVVSHDNLLNHCINMQEIFGLSTVDRVLQFTSPSFDVSVQEIFPTLLSGANLVLWGQSGIEETGLFLNWLDQQRITVLNLTTAHWNNIVSDSLSRQLAVPSGLKLVIVGGEKVTPHMLRSWRELVADRVRWINDYGLTETTVTATMYELLPDHSISNTVPLGKPIRNTSVYILDDNLKPVAKGIYGKLYVGGRNVAMGYYKDREQTQQRFLKNPFAKGRLFNTGDIARIRLDGTLEFDGRDDHQVKIRGHRVEVDEILSQLMSITAVKDAFVDIQVRPGQESKILVAYVVLDPAEFGINNVRETLHGRLPDYMVPAHFIELTKLPLTTNGKVDRTKLPQPNTEPDQVRETVPANTDLERMLVAVWADLLKLDAVSADASFFNVGGDSLVATTMVSRISQALNLSVPLRLLFENPVLRDFASVLEQLKVGSIVEHEQCLVKLQEQGKKTPLFYVHPVGGTVSCYFDLSQRLGRDQPFYAFQAHAMFDADTQVATVEDMAREYLKEIKAVQPSGPYRLGGWSLGGFIAYEMARILVAEGQSVVELSMVDTYLTKTRVADQKTILFNFVLQLAAVPGVNVTADMIREWGEQEFEFKDVCQALRSHGLIPPALDDDYVEHLLNVYMKTVDAFKKYDPAPEDKLSIDRVVLFRAKDSHERLGVWSSLVEVVEVHQVDADHFGIVHHPLIADILSRSTENLTH